MAEVDEGRRPLGVTIVAILVWAEGLLYVVAGMIILANLDDPDIVMRAGGEDLARPTAITTFVVALAFLGASGGLFRGTRLAAFVVTVLMTISLVVATYVISGGERILGGALIAAFAVAALILLWLPRSAAFFRRREPSPLAPDDV